jgi:hypothetical protein
MTWATIIAAIMATFGPMLAEWLKRWLEDKLKSAAALIPAPSAVGSAKSGMHAIYEAAYNDTPRRAFGRRALLRVLRRLSVDRAEELVRGSVTLAPDDVDELRDVAGAADGD